jgi:hypothetical protein
MKVSGTGFGPRRVYCSFLTIIYIYLHYFTMDSEIEAYFKRAVTDIARKCSTLDEIVITKIKQFLTI